MRNVARSLVIWVGVLLVAASAAHAEKVAAVLSRSIPAYKSAWRGFCLASRFEKVIRFNMEGQASSGQQIMQRVVKESPDLVVVFGGEAAKMAQAYLPQVPVIYSMVLDKPSFPNQPSAGILIQLEPAEQLRLIKNIFPSTQKIGVLYDPIASGKILSDVRGKVKDLGLELVVAGVGSQAEIVNALTNITHGNVDVMWAVQDQTTNAPAAVEATIARCTQEKIPFVALSLGAVKAGALMCFAPDFEDIGEQTLALAARMLKNPETSAAEYPKKVQINVNTGVQAKLGLKALPTLADVSYNQINP
jgi:putative tryptophan/tyrosine transport system substrate-binding protein